MNLLSLKQYAKYAAPLAAVAVIVSSVVAAPQLQQRNAQAAGWETLASCEAKKNQGWPTFMNCVNRDSVEGMVYRAYHTVVNRPYKDAKGNDVYKVERDGYKYWVGVANAAVKNGQNPTQVVVNKMMGTYEYGNTIMTGNPIKWVNELYVRSLERPATQAEVNYWVGQINDRKMTHAQVLAYFVQAEEQKWNTRGSAPCYVTNFDKRYCPAPAELPSR